MTQVVKLLAITDSTTHQPGDTTPALYSCLAQSDRVRLFHAPNYSIQSESGFFPVCEVQGALSYSQFCALNSSCNSKASIDQFDLVVDRSDSPYPEGHFEYLARYEDRIKFVGRPSSLISARRKSFISTLPELQKYSPDQIFTSDRSEIQEFFSKHNDFVVKRDLSYGGRGVFRFRLQDDKTIEVSGAGGIVSCHGNLVSAVTEVFPELSEGVQCVEFLRNVYKGDKRILVVGGEVFGGYLRKSSSGSWVQNIGSGGRREVTEVSARDREIVEVAAPFFSKKGIHILGFDFLLDNNNSIWLLSEINCGNVSGFAGFEELTGQPIVSRLADWIISY